MAFYETELGKLSQRIAAVEAKLGLEVPASLEPHETVAAVAPQSASAEIQQSEEVE